VAEVVDVDGDTASVEVGVTAATYHLLVVEKR
jgi:hypothetical protein